MQKAPDWYVDWRATIDFDTVEYGVGGIQLFRPDDLSRGQIGFAVATDGELLVGIGPGDWRPEWLVIGYETACGDPIFPSDEAPYPVFSAMHGEGSWHPKLVAPSIEAFAHCLRAFQGFAAGRSSPVEIDTNPPTPEQQSQFLTVIRTLTNGDQDALGFGPFRLSLTWMSSTGRIGAVSGNLPESGVIGKWSAGGSDVRRWETGIPPVTPCSLELGKALLGKLIWTGRLQ